MKKVLIIQTAFLGDVVLATSLLEKLKAHYPDAQLDILVRKGNEQLFFGHPYLQRVLVWNKTENKTGHLLRLLQVVRSARYDAVVNAQRHWGTGLLTAFSGASYRIGFNKNPLSFLFTHRAKHEFAEQLHETQRNQRLIAPLTDQETALPRLYPTEDDYEQVAPYKNRLYLCIAPGSVWFTKRLPEEKWVQMLRKLPIKYTVYFIGGPEEEALSQRIIEQSGYPRCENLCGKLSYKQSAALMENAALNFSNDSAPVHLAAAVNARVCAVFCNTSPRFGFGPIGSFARVVETREALDCRPCAIRGLEQCPQGHFKCGHGIEVEQLLQVVDEAEATV